MDKALCTACFDLEGNLGPGTYTFQWWWEFNVGEFYSSCFEAQVGGDVANGGVPMNNSSNSPSSGPSMGTPPMEPSMDTPPMESSLVQSFSAPSSGDGNSEGIPAEDPASSAANPSPMSNNQGPPAANPSVNQNSGGECSGFWQPCGNGQSCTRGSTCDGWTCIPQNSEKHYVQCGDSNGVDDSMCADGWQCDRANDHYAQCRPSPNSC